MVKIYKNLVVGLNFRKCSVQIFGNLYIGQYLRNLAKISKIWNLSNFRKLYLFLSFFYNLKIGENNGLSWFFLNCRKITIYLIFIKYLKSVRNYRKNIDLWNFFSRKISMFVKVFETVDFGKKTSILVKIFGYLNFGQGKGHFDFCQKFLKITILVKIFKKSRLITKYFQNHDFGQNFLISSVFDKIYHSIHNWRKI